MTTFLVSSNSTFIGIQNLKVRCIVGLLPFERVVPQKLILNLELEISSESIQNERQLDMLENSPNYFTLSQEISKFVQTQKFQTLETLTLKAAQLIFEKYPIIQKVSIKAMKPEAIPKAQASYVSEVFLKK